MLAQATITVIEATEARQNTPITPRYLSRAWRPRLNVVIADLEFVMVSPISKRAMDWAGAQPGIPVTSNCRPCS